ncbi:MAG: polynucleotide adenylyltransferase PcnB [Desulfurivibrionaceae bacterium]|nr:polynucleotide adenylyltransferase PcnB [Desulfurivibrionaceae bacterium]
MAPDLPEAKIIARDEHPISRNDIDREALKVLHRLRDAGYDAYLVGGGVRDLYLGKTPKDFDISTDARPGQLRKLFRNSRVIGKRFRLVQVFFHGGKIIEVSTLRCQSEYDIDGPVEVLAANNTYGTVAEDAFRRDLTINALFYEIKNFTIIDHVNGVADLKNKIVRIIGDPDRRIKRDPVRMMRAIRHAARLDFRIEPLTWAAIKQNVADLGMCPDSRLRDELLKDLKDGASAAWAELAMDCGLFQVLLPFYRKDPALETRKLLLACLAASDRLQRDGTRLPEQFLFALLMLPWGAAEIGLLDDSVDSGAKTKLSKVARDAVDRNLQHLNVKRAQKEAVTRLLTNLPVFIKYADKENWPAWLTRKSYFNDGLLFYKVYLEATGGPVVPDEARIVSAPPRDEKPAVRRKKPSRQSRTPAFADSTDGGVFGLRKK